MDKMPTYSYRDALRLARYLKEVGPLIAKGLEPEMAQVLEDGEEMPDVAHVLDVLGRLVLAAQARFEARDDDKRDHQKEIHLARFHLRREAMPVLRSRVKEVRSWIKSHVPPDRRSLLFPFKGRTPRSDEGLEDLADAMVRGLEALGPVDTPAGPVDPDKYADYLREPLEQASGLLATIDDHSDSRSVTVEKKAEAMRSYHLLLRRVARIGWIFSHLAGLERTARTLYDKSGRPELKIKKPEGPVNVA